jgi:uncharacterized repeat protein (TIGR03803 family)
MDSSGNLYGTTIGGGAFGDGVVFELARGSGTITRLASFNGRDGRNPRAGVIIDGSGNLYGTAYGGGVPDRGTVFELAQGSHTITTLAAFHRSTGGFPTTALLMDSSGNLYGTTGSSVFEVAQGSRTITTLARFARVPPGSPSALIMDSSGDLFGTLGGGSGYPPVGGAVFELAHGSSTITYVATLNNYNGLPSGALVMDSSGNLYCTGDGGPAGRGTVFELVHGAHAVTTLATFRHGDGAYPNVLLLDGSGDLYGTTAGGGAAGYATVFELPGAAAVTDQWTGANSAVDTNWSDGANWSLGTPPTAGQTALFTNNSTVQSFASTIDAGFTSAIGGLVIDGTWGGTITVNSALTVNGNSAMASGSFGGSGAVTIAGDAMQWTGGQIQLGAGGLTNTGVLNANTAAGDLVLTGAGTLTNTGTINEIGVNSVLLENTATLNNAQGGSYDIKGDGGLAESGGGALVSAGTLVKSSGFGTSAIATTSLDNTGTVEVASGTLAVSAAVTQVSGGTLTAGTWTVSSSSREHCTLEISSAGSFATLGSMTQVALSGLHTAFTNLTGLTTIDRGAGFSLLNGQSFAMTGALTNRGGLTLSAGSVLTVSGSFTDAPGGRLSFELGGNNLDQTLGQLVSTAGAVALSGSLRVTSTVVPPVGGSFDVLDNEGDSAITGTLKGLPEGATFKVKVGTTTMTFQITYAGADDDGTQNVLITRIS